MKTAIAQALALPERQRAVLVCLGRGLLAKEAAVELGVSARTISNTRSIIYRKLGVNTAGEAVRVACRAKLV